MSVSPLLLEQFKLLEPLPKEVIGQLCVHARLIEVPKRKILMEKGKQAHSLGLLLEGRLQGVDITLDGTEAGLYFIEERDFFGELPVIDQHPASEFVVSLSASRIITIPANIIHELINKIPDVAMIMNRRLAHRLRESMAQRTLLSMPTPLQRVCAQLTQMTTQLPSGEQAVVHLPTHQELAIMVNATRETVTRVFQKLQKSGAIKRKGDTLLIQNSQYLNDLADGES